VARQKITLASGSLRRSLPIDEEIEPDDIAPEADDSTNASSEPPQSA
jgi:hypothetical protein